MENRVDEAKDLLRHAPKATHAAREPTKIGKKRQLTKRSTIELLNEVVEEELGKLPQIEYDINTVLEQNQIHIHGHLNSMLKSYCCMSIGGINNAVSGENKAVMSKILKSFEAEYEKEMEQINKVADELRLAVPADATPAVLGIVDTHIQNAKRAINSSYAEMIKSIQNSFTTGSPLPPISFHALANMSPALGTPMRGDGNMYIDMWCDANGPQAGITKKELDSLARKTCKTPEQVIDYINAYRAANPSMLQNKRMTVGMATSPVRLTPQYDPSPGLHQLYTLDSASPQYGDALMLRADSPM